MIAESTMWVPVFPHLKSIDMASETCTKLAITALRLVVGDPFLLSVAGFPVAIVGAEVEVTGLGDIVCGKVSASIVGVGSQCALEIYGAVPSLFPRRGLVLVLAAV